MTTKSVDLYAFFQKRLDAFAHELPEVQRGSAAALHRARVASRRLRESIPLMQLDRDTTRKLARRFRKVTKRLGAVRELDVLVHTLEGFPPSVRCPSPALKKVSRAVRQARRAARKRLAARLTSAKVEKLVDRAERAVRSREVGTDADKVRSKRALRWALEALVARRAARMRAAVDAAAALYVSEHLHDVRIAVKKLRYAVELLHETTRQGSAADIATLKAVQDVLGHLHDLEVLIRWGRELQSGSATTEPTTRRGLEVLVDSLEDECRRLHARYLRRRVSLVRMADRFCSRATRIVELTARVAS